MSAVSASAVGRDTFSNRLLVALFESFQYSQDQAIGDQLDTLSSATLSDELWRTEAATGIMLHSVHHALAKSRVLCTSVVHKIMPHLRSFALANLNDFLDRLSSLLRPLSLTIFAILFLNLFSLMPGREDLESHITPKRIYRMQKNVDYHLGIRDDL